MLQSLTSQPPPSQYYSKSASWVKFADLSNTRFRISVRLAFPHLPPHGPRYMILIDLAQTPTVPLLVNHLCRLFGIHPPAAGTVYRDRDRQLVLALEPDILVHDVDALRKDDQVVLSNRKVLRMESTMMRDIGWGKSYEWGLYNQWKLQKQHGDEEGSEEAAYGDYTNYQNNSMFAQRVQAHLEDQAPNYSPPQIQYNPPQHQIQPQYSVAQLPNGSNQYQYPLRIFVKEDKCLTTPLMETPGVEDFNDLIQNITDKQILVNQVNEISSSKGFRLYRHSDTGNTREHRLVLLCSQYGICRCPFMLIYWKDFTKLNGTGDVAYQLMKYRSEHNHQLVPPSANSNDVATQNLFEDLQRQATSILQQTQSLMIQHQQQQQQLQNAYTLQSLTNPTFPTQNFQMPSFPNISAQQGSYTNSGFSNLSGTITANQLLPDNPFQLNNSPHDSSTTNNSPIFQFGAENPLTANFGNEVNTQQQQVQQQKGYKLEECVQKKRKEQQVMPKS